MKKATKVFLYLALIGWAIAFTAGFAVGCGIFQGGYSFIGGIFLTIYSIVPFIVACIALKRLDSAVTRDDLIGIGVVTLIFCSMVAGILMLCISDDDLNKD